MPSKKKSDHRHDSTGNARFVEAAVALECDESEEHFDAALKMVAAHKPPDKKPDHTEEKDKRAK
jgi:hypothetical protein